MAANEQVVFGPWNGLNNRQDPASIGGQWLLAADNVDVDDRNWLRLRSGYRLHLSGVTDLYTSRDGTYSYAIKDSQLGWLTKDGFLPLLSAPASRAHWCEAEGAVFCSLGYALQGPYYTAWGLPQPLSPTVVPADGDLEPGIYQVSVTYVDATGRESGAPPSSTIFLPTGGGIRIDFEPLALHTVRVYVSNADGVELYQRFQTSADSVLYRSASLTASIPLTTGSLHPPPRGGLLASWRGRVFTGHYVAEYGWSVVWLSQPGRYHYFALDQDYFSVPGKITLLADAQDGVIIGTDRAVYAYDGERLRLLAHTPVAADSAAWTHNGTLFFYTEQGVARALPFELLTQRNTSLPFSLHAPAGIIRQDGFERYVVSPQPDSRQPYNPYQDTITETVRTHGISL